MEGWLVVSHLGLLFWSPPKKELEVGRGVLGMRSEFSRELLGLSGGSEGSLFSSEAVVVELAVAGVATSGGVSLVGGAWGLSGEEVALVLVISCTWSLLTSCWLAGS